MVLFSVIGDIFRNRETSGFTKALWILLLIVLPFITLIVYLITHGSGMAERSSRQSQAVQAQQEAYVKNLAGTNSPADQVTQAKKLLDSGPSRSPSTTHSRPRRSARRSTRRRPLRMATPGHPSH
jgi:Phospholipase_D-nuclease N-terminal